MSRHNPIALAAMRNVQENANTAAERLAHRVADTSPDALTVALALQLLDILRAIRRLRGGEAA